jgi:hypothetical protein
MKIVVGLADVIALATRFEQSYLECVNASSRRHRVAAELIPDKNVLHDHSSHTPGVSGARPRDRSAPL